jgi:hypothetical protein
MLYYFWMVTGDPFRMPYIINHQQYRSAGFFVWQQPQPMPHFNHAVIRRHTEWENSWWIVAQNVRGFTAVTLFKFLIYYTELFWPLAIPLIIGSYELLRDRTRRWLPLVLIAFFAAIMMETWANPHYASPATALIMVVAIAGLQSLHRRLGNRPQMRLSAVFVLFVGLLFLGEVQAAVRSWANPPFPGAWQYARLRITHQLESMPGKHLAIVHYVPWHNYDDEWVYNAASIDSSKVVWARDMGPYDNRPMLKYFRDRRVWLVMADQPIPRLEPYPPLPLAASACLPGKD